MSYANGNCVETVRSGDNYYLLDAKDYSKGPVDIISAGEYDQRHEIAQLTGDPTAMFSGPEVTERFSDGELQAYRVYIAAGRVASLLDGEIVTAHENPELWVFPTPDLVSESLSVSQL